MPKLGWTLKTLKIYVWKLDADLKFVATAATGFAHFVQFQPKEGHITDYDAFLCLLLVKIVLIYAVLACRILSPKNWVV